MNHVEVYFCISFFLFLITFKKQDPDGFSQSVQDYEKVSRFDNWHTKLLLKVSLSFI
jgi:hypothetical protein